MWSTDAKLETTSCRCSTVLYVIQSFMRGKMRKVFHTQVRYIYIFIQILHMFKSIHFGLLVLALQSLALILAVHGEL